MNYIFALFNYDNNFNKNFVEINLIFLLETSSHVIKHEGNAYSVGGFVENLFV